MTDAPVAPVKEPQDPTKVVRPTDDEVTAVAVAMDIDNKLDFTSTEHTHQVNVNVAKGQALFAILAFRAVTGMAGFVAAVKAKNDKAAADKEAADKAKEAADKAAAVAKSSASAPVIATPPIPLVTTPHPAFGETRTVEAPVNVVAPQH
jgi:hypothetical protein